MAKTELNVVPDAAVYGDQYGGDKVAAEEAWRRMGVNDAAQVNTQKGFNYANSQVGQRGPQAAQDPTAAANQASGANGNQAGAIELARRQAMGAAPSAAAYQLQAGLNQGSAGQMSQAAGARGMAAIATAGANANANISNMQQGTYSMGGQLRAQEMAQGRGLYGTMSDAQRAQDAAALGESNGFGMANAKRADAYGLGMGAAAVGFGGVANGQNMIDAGRFIKGTEPIYAQTDAEQQHQDWLNDANAQADASDKKSGG